MFIINQIFIFINQTLSYKNEDLIYITEALIYSFTSKQINFSFWKEYFVLGKKDFYSLNRKYEKKAIYFVEKTL